MISPKKTLLFHTVVFCMMQYTQPQTSKSQYHKGSSLSVVDYVQSYTKIRNLVKVGVPSCTALEPSTVPCRVLIFSLCASEVLRLFFLLYSEEAHFYIKDFSKKNCIDTHWQDSTAKFRCVFKDIDI